MRLPHQRGREYRRGPPLWEQKEVKAGGPARERLARGHSAGVTPRNHNCAQSRVPGPQSRAAENSGRDDAPTNAFRGAGSASAGSMPRPSTLTHSASWTATCGREGEASGSLRSATSGRSRRWFPATSCAGLARPVCRGGLGLGGWRSSSRKQTQKVDGSRWRVQKELTSSSSLPAGAADDHLCACELWLSMISMWYVL